jgi:hypothetical protein
MTRDRARRSVYVLRVRAFPHTDGVKALRQLLKAMSRRYRPQALEVGETSDDKQEKPNAPNHKTSTRRTAEASRRGSQLSQSEHDHECR